jgi:L-lactate dehydrogenase complex protein LldF
MSDPWKWHLAQRAARLGRLLARGRPTMPNVLPPPLSGWTRSRDLPTPPTQTFVQQWTKEHGR